MNATVARLSFVLLTLCCAPLPVLPQQPSAPGVPSATNVPGALTPAIHPDRSITFTLQAPEASNVAVAGGDGLGAGPFPMTKGTDGTWSITTPPAVPGFHYYWFVLDGVQVNDPASRTYFGYGKETGAVEVPPANGAALSSTHLPATTRIRRRVIRCSFFSTARVKMKQAGVPKARLPSFSTI
jgi:hypothetical protein